MEAVFFKILNMSITAGWIAIAVILMRLIFKKLPKWFICLLWALVGIRLLLPFSFESVLSLIPSAETVPSDIVYETDPAIYTGVELINSAVNPVLSESFGGKHYYSANPLQIVSFIAANIWVLGIVFMLLFALISYIKIRIRVKEAVLDADNIYLCDRVDTPFILGIIRPKIYLPSSIDSGDKEFVLLHENAHIKRLDHIIKPFAYLLLCVYWFSPLLWISYALLCRDIEAACDERVLKSDGNKLDYSKALINCSASRRLLSACPLAFGETGVKKRIKGILSYKKPALWIIILSLVIFSLAAATLLTDPAHSSVTPIIEQKGFRAINVLERSIDITLRKDLIPETALNPEGMSFKKDKTAVTSFYDTSKLYIKRVRTEVIDNTEYVNVTFDFAYNIKKEGTVTVPYGVTINDGKTTAGFVSTLSMPIEAVNDGDNKYPNAAFLRDSAFSGEFTVSIKRDTFDKSPGFLQFSVSGFSDIAYIKKDLSYLFKGTTVSTAYIADNIELVPTDVLLESAISSFRHDADDAPSYRIVNGNELHETDKDAMSRVIGELIPVTLSEDNFDAFFKFASTDEKTTPKKLRKDCRSAWTVKTENRSAVELYTVLAMKDGSYYIAVGTAEGAYYRFVYKAEAVESSTKGELQYTRYEFTDSVDYGTPYLLLCEENKSFIFCYSSLSSYLPRGSYEFEGKTLTLKTDDGLHKYTFIFNGESYMFDAANSSGIPSYKYSANSSPECPVPDGALFENPQIVYW